MCCTQEQARQVNWKLNLQLQVLCLSLNQYSGSAQTNFPFYFCVLNLVPNLSPPCIVSLFQQKVIKHVLCCVLQGMKGWIRCYSCPGELRALDGKQTCKGKITLCGMWQTKGTHKAWCCVQTKIHLRVDNESFIASFRLLDISKSFWKNGFALFFIQRFS